MKRRIDPREDRGAALALALGVMLMVGAISAGLLAFITTSVSARPQLDLVRDREYAADGAVEIAIARVRNIGGEGPTKVLCGGPDYVTLNDVDIRVDCKDVPKLTFLGYLQRNVIFAACIDSGLPCTDPSITPIIRAQINYEATSTSPVVVTRTYVQSWSVNQ